MGSLPAGAGTEITQTAEFRPEGSSAASTGWRGSLPSFRLPGHPGRHTRRGRIGGSLDAPLLLAAEFSNRSCLLDGGTAEGAGQRGAKHARGTRQRWSLIGDASRHLVPARSATGRSARAPRAVSVGRDGVVPLFVLDESLLEPAGSNRRRFLAESLRALDMQLGGTLVLRRGAPPHVVPELAAEVGAERS